MQRFKIQIDENRLSRNKNQCGKKIVKWTNSTVNYSDTNDDDLVIKG